MKKYEKFVNEGLFGKKEGDEFTEKLLNIIEKEDIKVNFDKTITAKYSTFNGSYNVNVDGNDYSFIENCTIGSFDSYYIIINRAIVINNDRLKISSKLFKRLVKIYNNQNSKIELPDLSDLGRSSKKYNL